MPSRHNSQNVLRRNTAYFFLYSICAVGCAPYDAYDYRVMHRDSTFVDGCERHAWVGFSDTKEHGNERLAYSIIRELENAGWQIVTTDTNWGNQRLKDSAGSGARYLIYANTSQPQGIVYHDEPYHEQRRVMTIGVTEGLDKPWLIYIQSDSYPSIFAKSLVRALSSLTVYPGGSHICIEDDTLSSTDDL